MSNTKKIRYQLGFEPYFCFIHIFLKLYTFLNKIIKILKLHCICSFSIRNVAPNM